MEAAVKAAGNPAYASHHAQSRAQTDSPLECQLSIVIPTRNEAGNVNALRKALLRALPDIGYEVIVVDDSTDEDTRPLLHAVCLQDSRWTVIERAVEDQTGLGSAVVRGIAAARGRTVCVMDGDLQHPPEIIPALLAAVEKGADLAVASRYMKGGSRAGLAGPSRLWVSRACTWLAQLIFPEARHTSDPLTGFFCIDRRHVAGLELRPLGFKILLELLICAPGLTVVDVPFVFGSRHAGESKASTRQGVLFLRHLLSLFIYVPGSARGLKFAFVTAAGLTVFGALMVTLLRSGVGPLTSWLIASAASFGCWIAFEQVVAFRHLATHGEPDGARFHYPMAILAALASLTVFWVLALPGRHALLAMAAIAQGIGVLMLAALDHPAVWSRLRSHLLPEIDLQRLARRLGAQRAFWVYADDAGPVPVDASFGKLVTGELIAAAGRTGQPLLLVEKTSPRPQPRANIESHSALIIPKLDERGDVAAVAVLVRRSRQPFAGRHLDEALQWIAASRRWTDRAAGRVALQ